MKIKDSLLIILVFLIYYQIGSVVVLTLNGPLKLCGQAASAQFPSTGTFFALAVRPSRPRAGAFFFAQRFLACRALA